MTRSSGGGLAGVQVNHVGIIDPESGDIVAEVEVGARPGPVAFGEGKIWVGNEDEQTVTPIDAATREKEPVVSLERTPTGIVVYQNAIWVANGRYPDGSLQRIDPDFGLGETTEDAAAGAITFGGSALWTALNATVKKINPSTGEVLGETFAGSQPNGIAFGGGALWVSNGGGSTVQRFNPTTYKSGDVSDPIGVGQQPVAIAYGENAVWTANAGDDSVFRIDPANHALTPIPSVGQNPTAIAVGEGFVWVANSDDGTVAKIDPASREVVDTIETGYYPAGLAVGAGYVWVTVQAP